MATVTVRISVKSRDTLRRLAKESGQSITAVADRAIEEYRPKWFMEQANADYAALRADPEAWAEYQKELALWDATLMDGLDSNEFHEPLPLAEGETLTLRYRVLIHSGIWAADRAQAEHARYTQERSAGP